MCEKSSYAENFDEKIAYWFDNKNWFDGYDKQPILILDDFDDITKNIFHNNYSSISFNNNYQDSETNNDNYLPIEKIRTNLAKRNKNNQSDSETSSINSQDSENTKRYKQKKSKMPKLIEDI
ncbi:hypothetical protein C2G38_2225032 [Gigaspora rosea]|uniref:Uncharacterized protein n=1 Tax=Gigaspora rosea TaxID=44941 RepID=A0A397U2R5_9GLOM|nr:hypothetical protein C2G38_2225032 [Gigaspora rosea]